MEKPRQGFAGLWNISFGFFGIQIGFALQNANMSRVFQTLGASMDDLPALWVAAPLTGLIVQPIIGYMSDRTWNRFGRRRPYFLTGAILAALALFVMPLSPSVAAPLVFAAAMLWLLDASLNISMEPFRAFVGDMLRTDQHSAGYAVQTAFIGAGAVVGSIFPWFLEHVGVSNVAPQGSIPDTVKWSFWFGAAALLGGGGVDGGIHARIQPGRNGCIRWRGGSRNDAADPGSRRQILSLQCHLDRPWGGCGRAG